jgi:hypothetical protein
MADGDLTNYEKGFSDGLAAFAYSSSEPWAERGVLYVGTTGMTLGEAQAKLRDLWNYNPPERDD